MELMDMSARAYLGKGGPKPGVEYLDALSSQSRLFLPTGAGRTPYALVLSPDSRILAIGTRGGQVHLLGHDEACEEEKPPAFLQGAPVLAMSFVGSEELAVSDARGRCLLWNTRRPCSSPAVLASNAVLCALRFVDNRLVGLCEDGRVFSWPLSMNPAPAVSEAERPSRPAALVSLTGWPNGATLVYPAESGALVFYDVLRGCVKSVPAHDRNFLAVTVCGDGLVTVGRRDGCLKRWEPGNQTVTQMLEAPAGVVSACAVPGEGECLLLISESGAAVVYAVGANSLQVRTALPGSDYRVAVGLGPELIRTHERCERQAKAQRLSAEIERCFEGKRLEEAEPLIQQMERLGGFVHVALAARADVAAARGDLIKELELRHTLAKALPDDPASVPLLERYLILLQRLWLYEEAADVLRRISLNSPALGGFSQESRQKIQQFATAMSGDRFVIEHDESALAPLLMKAAQSLGRVIHGRYVIAPGRTKTCHGTRIAAADYVAKYEQMQGKQPDHSWPTAVCEEVLWLARTRSPERAAAVFLRDDRSGIRGLELACRFHHTSVETSVELQAVFNAGHFADIESGEERNRACLAGYEAVMTDSASELWLERVCRWALETTGRLANERIAAQRG